MEQRSNAELRQYFSIILKWWWLILIVTLVAGASAYLVSQASPKTYQAKTTISVGQFIGVANPEAGQINTAETLAQYYADLALREPVLLGTLEQLKLEWNPEVLKGMVTARVAPNSALLEISVVDSDPLRAKVLVENIAEQLILQGPGSSDIQKEAERQSILGEIDDIKANIKIAREELLKLNDDIAKASSQRQAQEARSRQRTLQEQISTWQSTYASLLTSLNTSGSNSPRVIEKPVVPTTPVGPRILENTLLAAVIGFVVAAAAALLIESLDDSIKNQDDVRTLLNLAPMGIITRIETGEDYPDKLVVSKFPLSSAAEAYRILRTNLQFKMVERSIRSLMVTSTQPMEGKSVTAANLAAVLAQSGKKVVLVDADLRRPTQHRVFEMSNSTGLTGALLEEKANLGDFMREDIIDNLSVMSSGPLPPNPSELLGSKRMADVIQQFQSICDIVIFDTAPVMSVADATALAGQVDGVLLVVDSGHTRRKMARMSYDALTAVGANVLGVVLNRVSKRGKDSSYSYYYPQRKDSEQPTGKGKQKKANPGFFGKKEQPKPLPSPAFTQAQAAAPAANGTAKKAIERQSS
jgi:non-specific protein-tyrosine kinase